MKKRPKGNRHNNGPHQDQIVDNPISLCSTFWAKTRIRLELARAGREGGELGKGGGGGTDAPNRLVVKGVGLKVRYSKFSVSLLSRGATNDHQ